MHCGQVVSKMVHKGRGPLSGRSNWNSVSSIPSVCRSYITHVATVNHSGGTSYKEDLSSAYLDGDQAGRQMQHDHNSPILSRYRDEREKAAKPSPTCVLRSSNPSSGQRSSSVEPLEKTNFSTTNVPKRRAQLAKASSSTTPEPAKPSPRPSTCVHNLLNPSSDHQSSSALTTSSSPRPLTTIAHLDALIKAAHSGDVSCLTRIRTFCGTAHKTPRKQRTELQRYALVHWRNRSPSVSSSMPSSSSQPYTTIAHFDALIKVAHSGDGSSLTRIRTFCSTAHRTPRNQRTELQRYLLIHWRNRPPSVSSSMPSSSPQPYTTITHLNALIKAAHSGDGSSLTRIRDFCSTAHRTPRNQRTELQRYALLHWRNRSPSVSNSVPSSELGAVRTFSTEIYVDSSAWGIGFVMDGMRLSWKFSDALILSGNTIDNNWAEMLAVEVGLWTVIHWVCSVIQKEGDVIKLLEIIVCSDNAGVVKAIDQRHSKFPPQQDILLRILDMVSKYDIKLSMKWIPRVENRADKPSRGVPGPTTPDLLPLIPALSSYLSDTLVLP